MSTTEKHRRTGKPVSFGQVLLSATYSLFMVSILHSIYSPSKDFENSTPVATEMQESLHSTFTPLFNHNLLLLRTGSQLFNKKKFFASQFSVLNQEIYPFSDLDLLLSSDDITEDDFLQLPDFLVEESETSPIKTPLNIEPTNLPITPNSEPTNALNIRPKNSKTNYPFTTTLPQTEKQP